MSSTDARHYRPIFTSPRQSSSCDAGATSAPRTSRVSTYDPKHYQRHRTSNRDYKPRGIYTICEPCRKGKTRCDKELPCGHCQSVGGRVCTRKGTDEEGNPTIETAEVPLKSKESHLWSCNSCYFGKRKCDRKQPSCGSCEERGDSCTGIELRTSVKHSIRKDRQKLAFGSSPGRQAFEHQGPDVLPKSPNMLSVPAVQDQRPKVVPYVNNDHFDMSTPILNPLADDGYYRSTSDESRWDYAGASTIFDSSLDGQSNHFDFDPGFNSSPNLAEPDMWNRGTFDKYLALPVPEEPHDWMMQNLQDLPSQYLTQGHKKDRFPVSTSTLPSSETDGVFDRMPTLADKKKSSQAATCRTCETRKTRCDSSKHFPCTSCSIAGGVICTRWNVSSESGLRTFETCEVPPKADPVQACDTCHKRKIKCDGSLSCANCQRSRQSCTRLRTSARNKSTWRVRQHGATNSAANGTKSRDGQTDSSTNEYPHLQPGGNMQADLRMDFGPPAHTYMPVPSVPSGSIPMDQQMIHPSMSTRFDRLGSLPLPDLSDPGSMFDGFDPDWLNT